MIMVNKTLSGKDGENIAAEYLKNKGYTIIDRNYYSRYGEIDIIAQHEKYIVFVEVKTRCENAMVTAFEAVDKIKQKKIIKTAMIYLEENKVDLQPRFDVIEVLTRRSSKIVKAVNQIENAFLGDDFYETF